MDRGSDKHAPWVDDEMERETRSLTRGSPVEARAEESRMEEPPDDWEPVPEEIVDDRTRSRRRSQ